VKRHFLRALFRIANLMTGFEVALALGSPLAYVALRALAALCFSVRRIRTPRGR